MEKVNKRYEIIVISKTPDHPVINKLLQMPMCSYERPYKSDKSILDLPIYKYDYINGSKNQIGCMAQDLKEICPEIVEEDEKGYLHNQETKIVYLLIEEIKKLKEEIKNLKNN